jgi:cbb3-type cytochrome oxidase subunit 3
VHGLMHTWDWFWTGFMIATGVVLIAVLVYAGVWFVIQPHHRNGHPS